jgi:predicted nucleic-acid-binding protein
MFDTNVLLDWLLKRDAARLAVIKHLLASGRRFLVPDAVIIEFVFVLETVYQFSRVDIVHNLRTLIDDPRLDCNGSFLRLVTDDFEAHPALSFVDIR